MQPSGGETPIVQSAALAEGHDFFGDGTRGLGFGHGGFDALVLDQAADQVGEHGVAMIALAAELVRAF